MSKFKFHSEITVAEVKDLKFNAENKINEILRDLSEALRLKIDVSTIGICELGSPETVMINIEVEL